MSRLSEFAHDAAGSLTGALNSTREAYDGASRFARMRLWVLGVFVVDVLAVVLYLSLTGGRPMDLQVWFQPGFPSNMIVFRNEGSEPLTEVQLLLDGQYGLKVTSLPTGLRGFEVSRDFRDPTDRPPPEGYRPQMVRVITSGDTEDIPVESRITP